MPLSWHRLRSRKAVRVTIAWANNVRACVEQPVCVAVRYLTLRIDRERHGSKNPLPFSFSKRSHVGNLRQTNE